MDIGVFVPLNAYNAKPEFLRRLAAAVEDRGFESIWAPEHVVLFDDYESQYPYSPEGKFPGRGDSGVLDPLTALTYIAAVTDRVRLGTGICLVPQRNPVYTAKQVADLDVLSGGRVEFGVGIGWLREEFEALNVPFERRGARTDEYLRVMKSLWTEEVSELRGDFHDLRPCRLYPKPVQRPHPPILVGGESDAAMRRAARFGQGWFTFNHTAEELPAALAKLDSFLEAEGRSRPEFKITVCPYLHRIHRADLDTYAQAGVDRLIALAFPFKVEDIEPRLDELAAELLTA
jgi:probable F420-dependent oxidoreductase